MEIMEMKNLGTLKTVLTNVKDKFKRYINFLSFGLMIFFGLSTISSASLIQTDLSSDSGDGLVTYDTVSNWEWLDLTQTNGMSFDYASQQMQEGGSLFGWAFASVSDVSELYYSAFGITDFALGDIQSTSFNMSLSDAWSFMNLVGITWSYDNVFWYAGNYWEQYQRASTARAYTDLGDGTFNHRRTSLRIIETFTNHNRNGYNSADLYDYGSNETTDGGIWLVKKPADVPVPASLALMGLGLAAIGYTRKRKAS